jgi:two-component system phosphate regulon sensor histidine kinase PhoR
MPEPSASVLYELPSGVVIVDAAGEVRFVTRRAEELLDKTSQEIAESLRDGTPPLGTLVSSRGNKVETFELERRDGTPSLIEGTVVEVSRSDELVASIVTFEDVSARERREHVERDFVTNAAHELQTPLAAIASAIQVLQAGAKTDPDNRDRFLAHIEQACDRLERLTRALLVLARAQTGERPRPEIVPVARLLHDVAGALTRDREIAVECPADIAVLANRPLLEQALTNLGQNAVKHSRGPIALKGARSNGDVRIQVRDSGAGISKADRQRVFERFYRRGAPGQGFGLGLAIVAESVQAIDGKLELESSPAGTNVSITLPAAKIVSA